MWLKGHHGGLRADPQPSRNRKQPEAGAHFPEVHPGLEKRPQDLEKHAFQVEPAPLQMGQLLR
jgi:hypothetical protein